MIDPRARRFFDRKNLALKHVFEGVAKRMNVLHGEFEVASVAEAVDVIIANDQFLRKHLLRAGSAHAQSSLRHHAFKTIQSQPDLQRATLLARIERRRTLLVDAMTPFKPHLDFLTYSNRVDGGIDVVVVKTTSSYKHGSTPQFVLSTSGGAPGMRVILRQGDDVVAEKRLDESLRTETTLVRNFRLETEGDYRLECYLSATQSRDRDIHAGTKNRAIIGPWQDTRHNSPL